MCESATVWSSSKLAKGTRDHSKILPKLCFGVIDAEFFFENIYEINFESNWVD